MESTHKLYMNKEDARVYGKLSAAEYDLSQASRYGRFILAKGWNVMPWSVDEMGETYLQQVAFITAMMISYGRAFTNSDGYGRFPIDILNVFDADERAQHEVFITLRNEVYAHTDSATYQVVPITNEGGVSDIMRVKHQHVDHDSIRMLIDMCKNMNETLAKKRKEIRSRY